MKLNYKKIIAASAIALFGLNNTTNAQQNIAGGWSTSYYLCNDGTVRSFGNNDSLSLGIGTSTVSSGTPAQVLALTNIKSIAAGYWHGLAIKNDSTVWSWGGNREGQLGDGTYIKKGTPVQVIGLTSVKAISGGQAGYHSLALKANGSVWSWGLNAEGQLGVATPTAINTPTLVPGITGTVIAIAGGEYHSIILKSDGTVWNWGRNTEGQLGNGTNVNSSTPVQVSGLSGVIAIAGGRYWSAALKNDGTVWTWGQNNYGQLGNGTTVGTNTIVQVSSLTNVKAIAASAFHGMALLNDSTVRTWGRNSDGQLGIGSTVNSSTIVTMIGVNQIIAIKAGTNYSLTRKLNGNVWAAGRNLYGQLGNGTMTAVENTVVATVSLCAGAITGVNETAASSTIDIGIFPNPSSGKFTIKADMVQNLSNTNYNIEVYNLLGEKVLSATKESLANETIDITDQKDGIYYVKITLGKTAFFQKLIKG